MTEIDHSICIYSDPKVATLAASVVRSFGTRAQIKVKAAPRRNEGAKSLFILRTAFNKRQKAIDAIANQLDRYPELETAALHCPDCGSVHVHTAEKPDSPKTIFESVKTILVKLSGGGRKAHLRCRRCGRSWSPFISPKKKHLKTYQ